MISWTTQQQTTQEQTISWHKMNTKDYYIGSPTATTTYKSVQSSQIKCQAQNTCIKWYFQETSCPVLQQTANKSFVYPPQLSFLKSQCRLKFLLYTMVLVIKHKTEFHFFKLPGAWTQQKVCTDTMIVPDIRQRLFIHCVKQVSST